MADNYDTLTELFSSSAAPDGLLLKGKPVAEWRMLLAVPHGYDSHQKCEACDVRKRLGLPWYWELPNVTAPASVEPAVEEAGHDH